MEVQEISLNVKNAQFDMMLPGRVTVLRKKYIAKNSVVRFEVLSQSPLLVE